MEQAAGREHDAVTITRDNIDLLMSEFRSVDFNEIGSEIVTLAFKDHGNMVFFTVHRNLACLSPFLKANFVGYFPEREVKYIDFMNTTKGAVGLWLRWLYCGTILDPNHNIPAAEDLIYLWLLAHILVMPRLQNAAIAGIERRKRMDNVVQHDALNLVYQKTPIGSPLRRLLVLHVSYSFRLDYLIRVINENPEGYTIDVLMDVTSAVDERITLEANNRVLLFNMASFLFANPENET